MDLNEEYRICSCMNCNGHYDDCKKLAEIGKFRCKRCKNNTCKYRCQYEGCHDECAEDLGSKSRCGWHEDDVCTIKIKF